MENYKITKKQIGILSNTSHEAFTYLNEEFPEVFKTELEVGKWYKMKGDTHFLCNFNGNIGNNGNSYGFNLIGEWMDNSMCFHNSDTYVEATLEEVEVALKAETIKRYGKHWENTKIKAHADGQSWIGNGLNKGFFSCGLTLNKVYSKHGVLYSHGNWAQILSQEKTVVPMDKALKIIAKKMKVSPENIEIQY